MDASRIAADDDLVVHREERRVVIAHRSDSTDLKSDSPSPGSGPPVPGPQETLSAMLREYAPTRPRVTLWLRGIDLTGIDLSELSSWKDLYALVLVNCDLRQFDLGQLDGILDSRLGSGTELRLYSCLAEERLVIPHIRVMGELDVRFSTATVLDLTAAGSPRFRGVMCRDTRVQEVVLPEASDCALETFRLDHNQIERIDLSNAVDWPVWSLDLDYNRLRSIDLAPLNGNAQYTKDLNIHLYDNQLEQLDLSVLEGRRVNVLALTGNPLKEVDVSHLTWGHAGRLDVNSTVRVIGKPDWMLKQEQKERSF